MSPLQYLVTLSASIRYTYARRSPYNWTLTIMEGSSNPVAFYLLGADGEHDAETVARQIEANFCA